MTTDHVDTATSADSAVELPLRCQYLAGLRGAWVASVPSADHQCAAVAPPAAVTQEKQRRLCLTGTHITCATYIAALESRSSRRAASEPAVADWGWVRTMPLVDARVGMGSSMWAVVSERRAWQIVPAVALVAALGALGLSNLGTPSGTATPSSRATGPVVVAASPTAAATPTAKPSPSATVVPTATPEPSPTPPPATAAATPPPTATPAPSARASYTVKSGDTLYGISRQFGVTVSALLDFNGLTSNVLHPGQVLRIP